MKRVKTKLNIDWKSKIIELLIVILGITISFQLNNLNESSKLNAKEKDYLISFFNENKFNESNLIEVLEFSMQQKEIIDTLKNIFESKVYSDNKIMDYIAKMMILANSNPTITTMESITASSAFELIKDTELRKSLINTYNTFNTIVSYENFLSAYVDKHLTPYIFNNIRLKDFTPINSDFIKDPLFENIVLGYDALLYQQIKGYEESLKKVKQLDQLLTTANNVYTK